MAQGAAVHAATPGPGRRAGAGGPCPCLCPGEAAPQPNSQRPIHSLEPGPTMPSHLLPPLCARALLQAKVTSVALTHPRAEAEA